MNRNKKETYLYTLIILVVVLTFQSCIYDSRGDCRVTKISFDYSYNILSSNALGSQVDHVTLYVFDEKGLLVMKQESEDIRITDDYSVKADQLAAGTYQFVAWAQSLHLQEDSASFLIPDLVLGASTLEDLTYYLKRTENTQQQELNNLLVGSTKAEVKGGIQNIKVALKKVNRKIRVLLFPYVGGSQLDVNAYDFRIIDPVGSGHINSDYSLIEDESITYKPYYSANVVPQQTEQPNPGEIDRAAVVELNTSRLMATHNARLIITSKENKTEIVNINLPWFFSLTEMEGHKNWDLQEYLDRQDEYVVTLFLQGDTWMQTTIIINGWVLNNLPLNM